MSDPSRSKSKFNNALEVQTMEEDWSGVVYDDDFDDDDDNDDDNGKDDNNYY
jgi:hypothetical protein